MLLAVPAKTTGWSTTSAITASNRSTCHRHRCDSSHDHPGSAGNGTGRPSRSSHRAQPKSRSTDRDPRSRSTWDVVDFPEPGPPASRTETGEDSRDLRGIIDRPVMPLRLGVPGLS